MCKDKKCKYLINCRIQNSLTKNKVDSMSDDELKGYWHYATIDSKKHLEIRLNDTSINKWGARFVNKNKRKAIKDWKKEHHEFDNHVINNLVVVRDEMDKRHFETAEDYSEYSKNIEL